MKRSSRIFFGILTHPTHLPGAGKRLVVDSIPVLFAKLAVVQIVTQNSCFVFGLFPLKQHRGVCVPDGHDRVRRGWNGFNVTNRTQMLINSIILLFTGN